MEETSSQVDEDQNRNSIEKKKERRIRIVDRKWRFEVRFRH